MHIYIHIMHSILQRKDITRDDKLTKYMEVIRLYTETQDFLYHPELSGSGRNKPNRQGTGMVQL